MTDRSIVYTSEQGRSTDFLFAQRATMISIAKLSQAAFGSGTVVRGLAVTPNSPAALNVLVGLGEVYTMAAVDATTWGSMPADTDQILQQGINSAVQTISTPAPSTSGYSINYLIECQFQAQDTQPVVLPFYNSANPQQPLNGQGGNGATLPTERQGVCVIQAKAGIAATTGTQVTPTVDSGWTALAVVTVANGQASVGSGNITIPAGVPLVSSLLQMMQTSATNYAALAGGTANAITATITPVPTSYTDYLRVTVRVAANNTGGTSLNVNGLGVVPVIGAAHQPLQGGELVAGGFATFAYSTNYSEAILLESTGGAMQVGAATQPLHAMQLGQATGRLINVQHFVAVGTTTYTPSAGTTRVRVLVVGGGALGGSTNATGAGQVGIGGGGGAGGISESWLTSGFSGVTITIGAGGTVGSPNGGTSSFGALLSASGGLQGGTGAPAVNAPPFTSVGGQGGIGSGGNVINGQGGQGIAGIAAATTSFVSGAGGQSFYGMGGNSLPTQTNTGSASPSAGGGGGGALAGGNTAAQNGGAGGAGVVVVYEYA